MLYYKVQGIMPEITEDEDDRRTSRERARRIFLKSAEFNSRSAEDVYCFVSDSMEGLVSIGIIADCEAVVERTLEHYLKYIDLQLNNITISEITLSNMENLLRNACRHSYIEDDDEVFERFNLDKIIGRCGIEYGENIVEMREREMLVSAADKYLMSNTLLPELERIYEGKARSSAHGHPVHYMVQTDDRDTRREVYKIVLDALYANNRIESRRYTYLDFRPGESFSYMAYDALYKTCRGGAVVVRYLADEVSEDDVSFGGSETIEKICEVLKRYRNKVLTIVCLPRECTKAKACFYENLDSVSFVELKEDLVNGEGARVYLKSLAKNDRIRVDKELFGKLEESEYLASELQTIYEEWYNNKLRVSIYPQYKDISTVGPQVIKSAPKGSAYDELHEMIGLSEAKQVIRKALNYYKIQKLYEEKGVKRDHPAMHMVFTGNPGTAKTTVARLFARIMRENGLLSKGQLVEVGRGELVGKFVGWTAKTVQSKFKAAIGGVLFIDEAYSLVDDRDGSFGDEAINTIVQEMENHREDVVVIFAGYPDKMESFLQKNPGLRSRIAFHIPFVDYDTEELCRIAKLIGKNKGMQISDGAISKLASVFDAAREQSDFGNGRYVRNVIEQARMNQASRLLELDFDSITAEDVSTLTAEDIMDPQVKVAPRKRCIGFY